MIPKPACDRIDYYVLANLMKAGFIAIALLPDATTGKRIEELRSEMELAIWLFMTTKRQTAPCILVDLCTAPI
jgi:hypothetical protein